MADGFEERPGGALFQRKKTKPTQPDWGGELILDAVAFQHLCDCHKAGQPYKLELSGWIKRAKSGITFVSLKGSPPFVPIQPGRTTPNQRLNTAMATHRPSGADAVEVDDEIPF